MTPLTNEKILFVDDDANVLAGYQRQLRQHFTVETAPGGVEALALMHRRGPFAVVVADMQMPHMNGIEFLSQVCQMAPNSVRMMLTGNADQQTAIEAVNEGNVFRFMTKPCQTETMARALLAGIRQYQLVMAEAELLEKTLLGCINVMTEMLLLSNPVGFAHVKKVWSYLKALRPSLSYPNPWELEVAALLSRLGHLTLPVETAWKEHHGMELSDNEKEMLARVPCIGHSLISKIPRMETVGQIIRYQEKHFNGAGNPPEVVSGSNLPLGARILKILFDLVILEAQGTSHSIALRLMNSRGGWYDPSLLDIIRQHFIPSLPSIAPIDQGQTKRSGRNISPELMEKLQSLGNEGEEIAFGELVIGDVLISDLLCQDGTLLVAAGCEITEPMLLKVQHYQSIKGVHEPICVAPNPNVSFSIDKIGPSPTLPLATNAAP